MRWYFRQLRSIGFTLVVSELVGIGMWVGFRESKGDPALLILAVLFTAAPLLFPILNARLGENGTDQEAGK